MIEIISTAYAADLRQEYAFGNQFNSLGDIINRFISPAINIFGLIILAFLIYAGFKYLTSGGNKEDVAAARAMVTNAIVGFVLFLLLFLAIIFLQNAFGITGNEVVNTN